MAQLAANNYKVIDVNTDFEGYKIYYNNGYPTIYKDGTIITIHTIVMERKLGRKLKTGEVVHHIDEDKHNYSQNNLLCFASNADHAAFHKGCEVAYDKEGIAYCPHKCVHPAGKSTSYNACPACGKLKTSTASFCSACSSKKHHPTRSTNNVDELKSSLEKDVQEYQSITDIASKYGVSRTTIKRWLKKCNITETPSSLRIPPKEKLEKEISQGTLGSVSRLYNVDKSTVKSWLSKYNIPYSYQHSKPVKCLTTNESFNSLAQAAKTKYPKSSLSRVKKHIRESCEQNIDYKGLYWEFI